MLKNDPSCEYSVARVSYSQEISMLSVRYRKLRYSLHKTLTPKYILEVLVSLFIQRFKQQETNLLIGQLVKFDPQTSHTCEKIKLRTIDSATFILISE